MNIYCFVEKNLKLSFFFLAYKKGMLCLEHNMTLIPAWTLREAAHYLGLKIYFI